MDIGVLTNSIVFVIMRKLIEKVSINYIRDKMVLSHSL